MINQVKLFLVFLFAAFKIHAQCDSNYGTLVISEIYFDTHYNERLRSGGFSHHPYRYHNIGEYIEIYNSSNEDIDLTNWTIKDNHTEYTFRADDGMNNNLIISAGGFKIITYNSYKNGSSFEPDAARQKFLQLFPLPNINNPEEDIILQNKVILYNSVDKVALYAPTGGLVDEISYINGSTTLPNPVAYLNLSTNQITISILPKINNREGGFLNHPIGQISIFVPVPIGSPGFPGTWITYQTTRYKKTILRNTINSFYSSGGDTFAVGTATPLQFPPGINVPQLPLNPMLGYTPPNENNLNYTELISHNLNTGAIDGYSKAYFNDFGLPTVSLSQDYKTGHVWGTEIMYDSFGRKHKESFPTPSCFGMKYINFLSSSVVKPLILDKYYNDNNVLEPYQANAEQPYTEINYDLLNPGNVINVVGGNRINNQWKTGYSFTIPAAQEMYYIYGYDHLKNDENPYQNTVEIFAKFYKTISIDSNGVENVVFTDSEGKTLATAKSGTGAPYSYPVVSLIGAQGYIDIHIPSGTADGNLIGAASQYDVYDLQTGYMLPPSATLPSGHVYRVALKSSVPIPTSDPVIYINKNNGSLNYTATFGVTYSVNYYNYDINVFNKTGQLVKNIQPNGFQSAFPTSITIMDKPAYMNSFQNVSNFATSYKYNGQGQIMHAYDCDEGVSFFSYRKDGQVRYSLKLSDQTKVFYTNYDDYARPIESGVIYSTYNELLEEAAATPDVEALLGGLSPISLSERVYSIYDYPENNTKLTNTIPTSLSLATLLTAEGIQPSFYLQKNLSGNVAITYSQPSTTITSITWYSYNIYGNVEWIVQYIEGLGIKTIDYEYDYNGNVTKVIYEKNAHGGDGYFAHQYFYDTNDVLQKVQTINGVGATPEVQAEYTYYISGELKRINIGQGMQGIDYVYTLDGRLKSINHPSLEQSKDPGNDINDVFGETLDYYQGDYTRANSNIATSPTITPDYRGNIKAARWSNRILDVLNPDSNQAVGNDNAAQKAYTYEYDRNGYLTDATFGNVNAATAAINLTNQYREENITYDPSGNIKTLKRTNDTGTAVDDLSYHYDAYAVTGKLNNELTSVTDNALSTSDPTDIETQAAQTYKYNEFGRLTADDNYVYNYNSEGLVTSVWKKEPNNQTPIIVLVKFYYNERGERVKKESYNSSSAGVLLSTDYYVRDLSGNITSVYEKLGNSGLIGRVEIPIYGINRLGEIYKNVIQYEIRDHLGNVRALIRKDIAHNSIQVNNYADYYPYGEKLPNRNGGFAYRFAFQGQEKDTETEMEAFQLRLWDGRLGRWLTTDPKHQYASPYLGMGNNPINLIDPDGGSDGYYVNEAGQVIGWDGINDDKYYLVTNKNDMLKIMLNNDMGTITRHSDLSGRSYLMPSYEMRMNIKSIYDNGAGDTTKEYAGTIRGSYLDYGFYNARPGATYVSGSGAGSSNAFSFKNQADAIDAYSRGILNKILYVIHTHNIVYPGDTFGGIPTAKTQGDDDYNNLHGGIGIVLNTRIKMVYIHGMAKNVFGSMPADVFFNQFNHSKFSHPAFKN